MLRHNQKIHVSKATQEQCSCNYQKIFFFSENLQKNWTLTFFHQNIFFFLFFFSLSYNYNAPASLLIEGNTLLIAAVRYKNVEATRLLLNVGHSEPSCHNKKGNTALHYAAASGNVQIVNLLLKKNLKTTTAGTATNNTTYVGKK